MAWLCVIQSFAPYVLSGAHKSEQVGTVGACVWQHIMDSRTTPMARDLLSYFVYWSIHCVCLRFSDLPIV